MPEPKNASPTVSGTESAATKPVSTASAASDTAVAAKLKTSAKTAQPAAAKSESESESQSDASASSNHAEATPAEEQEPEDKATPNAAGTDKKPSPDVASKTVPPASTKAKIPEKPVEDRHATVVPATATEGGRETSKTILYVGNLESTVSEEMLNEIFTSAGKKVKSLKLLPDKNKIGYNYSFVEFEDHDSAESIRQTFDGKLVASSPMKVTWAYKTQQSRRDDAYALFVGDLSPDIDDETLKNIFKKFPSVVQANVMWDMKSGRSRGYGFVAFKDSQDAEKALRTMDGSSVGGRPIRVNWAMRRTQGSGVGVARGAHRGDVAAGPGGQPGAAPGNMQRPIITPESYQMVLGQTPSWLCAVYLGNLGQYTTQGDLIPLLQNFGYIVNFKMLPDKGCAFVTYDTHERAALAIVQLNGFIVNGRALKCGWGKANKVRPFQQHQPYGRKAAAAAAAAAAATAAPTESATDSTAAAKKEKSAEVDSAVSSEGTAEKSADGDAVETPESSTETEAAPTTEPTEPARPAEPAATTEAVDSTEPEPASASP